MDPNGTIKLVGAILRGTLSLPGAACRGRYELYDEVPGQSRGARAQRCELAASSPRSAQFGRCLDADPVCRSAASHSPG